MNQQGSEFYEIQIVRRPHGCFHCSIMDKTTEGRETLVASEGFFTTSLPTMEDVSRWIENELKKLKQ